MQGGDPCLAGTRIPIWVLATMHKQGDTVEDVLEAYPDLSSANSKLGKVLTGTLVNVHY